MLGGVMLGGVRYDGVGRSGISRGRVGHSGFSRGIVRNYARLGGFKLRVSVPCALLFAAGA
jgi:hypothetical protein